MNLGDLFYCYYDHTIREWVCNMKNRELFPGPMTTLLTCLLSGYMILCILHLLWRLFLLVFHFLEAFFMKLHHLGAWLEDWFIRQYFVCLQMYEEGFPWQRPPVRDTNNEDDDSDDSTDSDGLSWVNNFAG